MNPPLNDGGHCVQHQQQQQQHLRVYVGEEEGVIAELECQLSVLRGLMNLEIKQREGHETDREGIRI